MEVKKWAVKLKQPCSIQKEFMELILAIQKKPLWSGPQRVCKWHKM
jgi:hypothetical protein